jgi:hypothetical protein
VSLRMLTSLRLAADLRLTNCATENRRPRSALRPIAEADVLMFQLPTLAPLCVLRWNGRSPGRWIGKGGPLNWSPRSRDLTPLGIPSAAVQQRHRAERKGRVPSWFPLKDYSACRCNAGVCALSLSLSGVECCVISFR